MLGGRLCLRCGLLGLCRSLCLGVISGLGSLLGLRCGLSLRHRWLRCRCRGLGLNSRGLSGLRLLNDGLGLRDVDLGVQVVVEVHVLIGRADPAKIGCHGVLHQLIPCCVVVPVQACPAEHRVAHLVAVEVREREARALAGELVVGGHGVAETARLAYHGQGAVAHGDHLREAARLEERRHEEHVGAGIHAMREGVVECDARSAGARILIGEVAHRLLVIAGAEHGHLHAAGKDAVERVRDEVHALLAGEARDHDHERPVVAHLEAELFLESGLAGLLARHICRGVVGMNHRVGRRVPGVGIDAVQNAGKHVRATAQDPVETLAVLRRLDLPGVARAHRGDGIGVIERALHVVDRALVAAKLARSVGDVRHAEDVVQDGIGVLALECDVMDREHGLHALIQREPLVELAEEHRCEGGVPVVAMEHVALEALGQVLQALGHGLREEGEALAVIEEAIGVVALEVALVIDEEVRDAVDDQALQAAVLVPPTKAHVEVGDVLHAVGVLGGDGAVFGHHDDHVGACGYERAGQRSRDIAQATGLDERGRLRRGEHHLHLFI